MNGPPPLPHLSLVGLSWWPAGAQDAVTHGVIGPRPPAAGGPRSLADVTRERKELGQKWNRLSSEELRLRRELNQAWVNIGPVDSLLEDVEAVAREIEAQLKGTFLEHESWASGRMPQKLDEMRQNARELVAQLLPELQARFSEAWVAHLNAESDVKEVEARYLQAIDREIELLGASGKGGADQQAERTKLEVQKAAIQREQKNRTDFLEALQRALNSPRRRP
jgi:hypothetical protein